MYPKHGTTQNCEKITYIPAGDSWTQLFCKTIDCQYRQPEKESNLDNMDSFMLGKF